jgi:diacylglycerol kinase (ATP)
MAWAAGDPGLATVWTLPGLYREDGYYLGMTAPVFVVVNPAAGSGRARRLWPAIAGRLRELGLDYQFEVTQGRETAESFTRQALRAGAETIVAVGGDGTFNEAVNGFFLDDEVVNPNARFVLVPAGSSSDVARGLAIPNGLAAVDLIRDGQLFPIDIGRATFTVRGQGSVRYFVNNADAGIGARIASGGTHLKRAGGRAAFFLSSLLALANPRPWSGQVRLDDQEPRAVRAVSVVAALGPYTGGGMMVAPGAKWDDGLFDVITIDAMSPGALFSAFPRIYNGTHLSHPKVHQAQAREIVIETIEQPPIELDGEVVGSGGVGFRILPGAIPLYVPRP